MNKSTSLLEKTPRGEMKDGFAVYLSRIISKLQQYFKRLARGFIGEGDFLLFN
jgi:hypothetical protein